LTDSETGLPNALAQELSIPSTSISGATLSASTKAAASGNGPVGKAGKGRLMTPEEKKRVVEALMSASTTEEVRKLERMLAEGLVPEGGINA
jgi:U2 small nuclear ribonucleoprotein A'